MAATPPDRLPRYFPIIGASLPREGLTPPQEVKARVNESKKNIFLLFCFFFFSTM